MRSRGFTILEIVVAIGLSAALIGLLTTAINLYLVRVDASRSQVETAQLARSLFNLIAQDLKSARYSAPTTGNSEAGDGTGSVSTDSSPIQGIFGTAAELRIDRAAVWDWANVARQTDAENPTDLPPEEPLYYSMPQTVRYLLVDGREMLTTEFASLGVSEEPLAGGYAGLYRAQLPTAVWQDENETFDLTLETGNTDYAELLAPEVVDISFAYFNGTELLTEWDCSLEESLPAAVEVRITLLKEPFGRAPSDQPLGRDELRASKENLIEYRRFIRLTDTSANYEAAISQ